MARVPWLEEVVGVQKLAGPDVPAGGLPLGRVTQTVDGPFPVAVDERPRSTDDLVLHGVRHGSHGAAARRCVRARRLWTTRFRGSRSASGLLSAPARLGLLNRCDPSERLPVVSSDSERFEAFVAARYRQLVLLAFAMVGDHAAAEDLVQECLVKMWKAWSRIEQDDPVGYGRVVLARTYASSRRRRWIRERPLRQPPDILVRPEQDRAGDADELLRALRMLPKKTRMIVVLRYREDMSERAVAEALGCSTGSVKSQASRGLARLREVLAATQEGSKP
jgi:RNA polymerase sigma-70 factor (sigma-E family)